MKGTPETTPRGGTRAEAGEEAITLSIVTPSFNQGEFLAETIESVIGQEGDFHLDYVVVDGGSTDRSVAVIRHYDELLRQGKWPVRCRGIRYRWLSEADRGQADALRKGFAGAAGSILAWLNSDDAYLPGTLQAVVAAFRESPEAGMIYGEAHFCDAAGRVVGRYRTEAWDARKLAWFNFICQPSAFFSREAFEAVGGVDTTLQFSMDYDLWIRIARQFPCRYRPGFLSLYRLHGDSKTIRTETLLQNSEEALRVAMRHYGWAPLTRVYATCRFRCLMRLPDMLVRRAPVLAGTAIICTLLASLRLNRGFRAQDLNLLTRENFGKLFKSRIEIMTGSTEYTPPKA